MGEGNKDPLNIIENEYNSKSTIQQVRKAATGAATMSAIVCGSINIFRFVQQARVGKLSIDEAVKCIVVETATAAADSAVKASANAGIQSLMVRYGAEKAVIEGLAKQSMKSMFKTNVVTVGIVCTIDSIKDLVRLGTGTISKDEFYERQGKNFLNTTAGVVGGSLGTTGALTIATSLGISAGTTSMMLAGVIGGLSGGIIAGLAMSLAIENGIEKPYRDLINNTELLHSAARELESLSKTVFLNNVLFSKILEKNVYLETELNQQFDRIDASGLRSLNIINKI
jgi:hypothetical protein